MLSKVFSAAVLGIDAYIVEVEVDSAFGLPSFAIVGLPDTVVKESKERVKSALKNSGFEFPSRKVTINLAPASLKKEGSLFDLPIAFGLLASLEQIPANKLSEFILTGELALDGTVRPVKGILSIALSAKNKGKTNMIVPYENAKEAGVVEGINVYPIKTLMDGVRLISGENNFEPFKYDLTELFNESVQGELDFMDVKGQEHAKRGLEIAASGGHNVLMIGPPGTGKTMLAKRFSTILPKLSLDEAIELTKIYSVTGLLSSNKALVTERPFRSPHHTVSDIAIIGGGTHLKPGEISLAHHGVLFLDEFPEFHRDVLESLRQPLEDGVVSVARAAGSFTYPAQFILVSAMNPCPCGYYTHPVHECICTTTQIQKYKARISGPLLDRIDIHLEIPPIKYQEIAREDRGEPSSSIREKVQRAREIQQKRFKGSGATCNARMSVKQIKKYCKLDESGEGLLKKAVEKIGLSNRAIDKVLKIARTIADLENEENIKQTHIAEAIQYRSLDRFSL